MPIIDPRLNPPPDTGRPGAPMPIGTDTPSGRPRIPGPVPRPEPGERWSWRLTVNGLTWDSTGSRPDGRPCPPPGWGGGWGGGWTGWHGHWGGLVAATPDSPYWWRRNNTVRNSRNNWWYGSFDPWDCRATGRRYSWWFTGPNFWVWRHFGSGSWTNWNGYYRYRNAAFIDGAFFAPAIDSSLLPATLSTPTAQIPGVPTPGSTPATLSSERPDYDLAIESFAARNYREAYSSLRRHLRAEPTDAQAMRLLALTLAQQGKLSDAAAMTRMAYRTNPNLAVYPFDPVELGFTEATLRRLANTCVTYAHRVDSASAFLLAASVVQAEWREDVAQRLLERAEGQGLDRDIHDAMAGALKNPVR
jgi:hypothetical protein